jgi:hypothetical protein
MAAGTLAVASAAVVMLWHWVGPGYFDVRRCIAGIRSTDVAIADKSLFKLSQLRDEEFRAIRIQVRDLLTALDQFASRKDEPLAHQGDNVRCGVELLRRTLVLAPSNRAAVWAIQSLRPIAFRAMIEADLLLLADATGEIVLEAPAVISVANLSYGGAPYVGAAGQLVVQWTMPDGVPRSGARLVAGDRAMQSACLDERSDVLPSASDPSWRGRSDPRGRDLNVQSDGIYGIRSQDEHVQIGALLEVIEFKPGERVRLKWRLTEARGRSR